MESIMSKNSKSTHKHENISDTFSKLESQLKALLTKASSLSCSSSPSSKQSKSKNQQSKEPSSEWHQNKYKYSIPPDEANFALGKQIAIVYFHIYLQCCCSHHKKNINNSNVENLKWESKWKELGVEMIQNTFIGTNYKSTRTRSSDKVADALISAFFNSLCVELIQYIQSTKRVNDNEDDESLTTFLDNFRYWWTGIIAISEQQQSATAGPGAVAISTLYHYSIQYYLKFAYNTFTYLNHTGKFKNSCYADKVQQQDLDDHFQLIRLYYKLQHEYSQTYMVQHLIATMFCKDDNYGNIHSYQLDFITPLLLKLIVKGSSSSSSEKYVNDEVRNVYFLITGIIRESSVMIYNHQRDKYNVIWDVLLPWLINTCFTTILSQSSSSLLNIDRTDLYCQLCDLVTTIVSRANENHEESESQWEERTLLIQSFINITLFHIHTKTSSISASDSFGSLLVQPLLIRMNNLLSSCYVKRNIFNVLVSSEGVYHLIMATLLSRDEHDIGSYLELLSRIVTMCNNESIHHYSPMLWSAFNCISYMFINTSQSQRARNERNNSDLKKIMQIATTALTNNNVPIANENNIPSAIRDIYFQSTTIKQQLDILNTYMKEMQSSTLLYTTLEQCEMLLFGLSLLVQETYTDNGNHDELIYSFLSELISKLPHLGRRSLPVLKILLQHIISKSNNIQVHRMLEFICKSIVYDASCAHEVWTLITTLMNPASASIRVQSMVLRLYPLLCNTNKRLYGRIITSVGTYISHPIAELRVVTASTVCELAKLDLIRDVSDVIGWLQSFLIDEEDIIVHFAILSLHYLVISGELDYTIVLKVLNKKLVKFDGSIDEILKLSPIVIESIVKFLGDGEVENEDESSGESDDERQYEKTVSPHVQLSISTLCCLALSFTALIGNQSDDIDKLYTLNEIFTSLSRYSIDSFDIDEDLICVEDGHDNRYTQLRRVIDEGNKLVAFCAEFSGNEQFAQSVKDLSSKLEEIEHKSPVSLRWIQQHRSKK